ncbi:ENV1 protein, partial [Crocuta crocuta]
WWACSTGLSPCIHSTVLNHAKDFCVLVQLVPQVLYHANEEIMKSLTESNGLTRVKKEPVTALTLTVLLGLGVTGAGTGISALATQSKSYQDLRMAIDIDLQNLETSIAHLQESLTSLEEVVLQNRRGLDLLFLQQGGLCADLGEECCFYVDHAGIVKESLAKVREGLAKRKREYELNQSRFEKWFNSSPWLTTLISTILGPLLILLLILTFGPCILNKIIQYIKQRLGTLQLMV